MKTLKNILGLTLIGLLSFTSCQKEEDNEFGQDPNTNGVNSVTKRNLERTAMFDGSFDDFLDGNACTSVLLPVTAVVNGTQVAVISESDLDIVLDILGEFNTDDDQVELQFPLTVMTSNYTEVIVNSQGEFDSIVDACESAEAAGEDAISCLDINFPMTILTYNVNAEQTGSVVFESEEQLFTYMSNLSEDELFSVSYPISIEFSNGASTTIDSDSTLQASIDDCTFIEDEEEQAEENADALEQILVDGLFRVESFVNTGVETANDFVEFTIDFSNDLSVRAENTVNGLINDVEGTYEVTSQTEVFLSLEFQNSTTFELLNQTWEVTSFSSTSIELTSTTNAAVTLVLTQI